MLIPSFFITEPGAAGDLTGISLPEQGWLVFRVRIGDGDRDRSLNDTLYRSLFSGKIKFPFCLLIEAPDEAFKQEDGKALIDYVLSCTSHFYYLKFSYNIPFLLFKGAAGPSDATIALFREKFMAQGYSDIDYIRIMDDRIGDPIVGSIADNIAFASEKAVSDRAVSDKTVSGKVTSWIYAAASTDEQHMAAVYDDLLNNSSAHPVSILFECQPERINALAGRLSRAEADLEIHAPDRYQLLSQNREWEKRQKEFLVKIAILQEKIDSLENYYAFYQQPDTGYKKQVTEITDFYNNEYEILPLWYKRFGHLLKVLTGKRTFRSLFNDNVKKYKT